MENTKKFSPMKWFASFAGMLYVDLSVIVKFTLHSEWRLSMNGGRYGHRKNIPTEPVVLGAKKVKNMSSVLPTVKTE